MTCYYNHYIQFNWYLKQKPNWPTQTAVATIFGVHTMDAEDASAVDRRSNYAVSQHPWERSSPRGAYQMTPTYSSQPEERQ